MTIATGPSRLGRSSRTRASPRARSKSPTRLTRSASPTSRRACTSCPTTRSLAASARARRSCPRRPTRTSRAASARARRPAPPATDVTPGRPARQSPRPSDRRGPPESLLVRPKGAHRSPFSSDRRGSTGVPSHPTEGAPIVTVLCRAYTTHDDARRAVDALRAAGVPTDGLRVLMGEPERDARVDVEGEFAGAVAPGDRVGAFAGSHTRGEGAGAFAGDASMQRGGSFADVDRDLVTTFRDGIAHMRVVGHRDLRGLLEGAGLDRATAERDVAELHRGRVLVLVDAGSEAAAVEAALGAAA